MNTETGESLKIVTSDHDEDTDEDTPHIRALGFSPDGRKIVSGTTGGHVQLWDVVTGAELSSYFEEQPAEGNSYREPILNFAFSSDGSLLAVGSTERIRMIGSAEHTHFKEVSDTDISYEGLLFSPDDSMLICGHFDGRIQLLDVATGDILTTLDEHSNMIEALAFSPDNKTLMSVGGGNILLWDWDKVIMCVNKEEQKRENDVVLHVKKQSTENVLQFVEHSLQKPKSAYHALTLAEVYLANEWYEAALEQYKRNLYITTSETFSTPKGDLNVIASPKLERKLFTQIARASKNVKDIEGYANMLKELIDLAPDRLNIQINSHIILAKLFGTNGLLEKAEEHIQKTESITEDIPSNSLEIRINTNIAVAEYYREYGPLEKADEYIQETESIIENVPHDSLRTQLNANFALAEYYSEYDMLEKADEHIQKTGFVTEDAWMVLDPFDSTNGIGYDTAYIPEDITEIDLTAKYDGLDGKVRWKQFTDNEFDGYIQIGEEDVDWRVAYAFATVTSPDKLEVEIRFDSDDQGKVWLNGKEVFSHTKVFMAIVDTYTIPVTLKQGKNSILVKVCNEKGPYAFYLRITDEDGKPFDDLIINRITENKE